jgi:hypothetical protein
MNHILKLQRRVKGITWNNTSNNVNFRKIILLFTYLKQMPPSALFL